MQKNLFSNTATVTVVLALGCKNLQQLCQNPTLWKHVNSAGFAIGITKSEFYPHCVAASKFPFVQ